jgi:hypothetical protein
VIDSPVRHHVEWQANSEYVQDIVPRQRDRWRLLMIFSRFGPVVAGNAAAPDPANPIGDAVNQAENDYYRFLNYPRG